MKSCLFYCLIIFAGLFFDFPFLYAADKVRDPGGQVSHKDIIEKKKNLGTLQKKMEEYERKKRRAQGKEKVVTRDLKKISADLKARQKEISIYAWNLGKNKREEELLLASFQKIADKKRQLTEQLIKEVKIRFKESLIPQFIAFPSDLGSLTIQDELDYLFDSSIVSFGQNLNQKLSNKEEEKEKLERYRDIELTYKKIAEEKEEKAKSLHKKKKKLLTRYQKEKKEHDRKIKEFKEQMFSLEQMIKALEKTQRLTRGFRGGYFRKSKGKLFMPVDGQILKVRYGKSTNIYKGIMIKAPRGKGVVCVADGKVMYGDWFRGFGNILIIDHGGGYSTLYAHLEETMVEKDDLVKEGQVIAAVGDTGSLTTEPRLYFEIRRYGESLNPLEWLKK